MASGWQCRLTVTGPRSQVRRFRKSQWNRLLKARHGDLLEALPGRTTWQFDSVAPLPDRLRQLSRRWPGLVFLLDYEAERQRQKGLVKAQAGLMAVFQIEY